MLEAARDLGILAVPLTSEVHHHWRDGFVAAEELMQWSNLTRGGAGPGGTPRGWTGRGPGDVHGWYISQDSDPRDALGCDSVPPALEHLLGRIRPLQQALVELANSVLVDLCGALGWSSEDHLRIAGSGDRLLRPTQYPALPDRPNDRLFRVGTHRDINLITVLPEPRPAGLEFEARDGTWWTADRPADHALVVIGQMLSVASGGRCWAARHRTRECRVPGGSPTLTLPLFVYAPLGSRLATGRMATAVGAPTAATVLGSISASTYTDRGGQIAEIVSEARPPQLHLP